MTNPCLKGMVKIGYAKNVESRRKQLSTTALPTDYEIYATYETQGNLEDKKLIILVYLVQASCNIRTLVLVLFGC